MSFATKLKLRNLVTGLLFLLGSFTTLFMVLIFVKYQKLLEFPDWFYRADFSDPKVWLQVKEQYVRDFIWPLAWWFPVALVADVTHMKIRGFLKLSA